MRLRQRQAAPLWGRATASRKPPLVRAVPCIRLESHIFARRRSYIRSNAFDSRSRGPRLCSNPIMGSKTLLFAWCVDGTLCQQTITGSKHLWSNVSGEGGDVRSVRCDLIEVKSTFLLMRRTTPHTSLVSASQRTRQVYSARMWSVFSPAGSVFRTCERRFGP